MRTYRKRISGSAVISRIRNYIWNYPYYLFRIAGKLKRFHILLVIVMVASLLAILYYTLFIRLATHEYGKQNLFLGVTDRSTQYNPLDNSVLARTINKMVFNSLFSVDANGIPSASLASSWTMNESNTSLDVILRHDVRWQDGQGMSADDVIYSFNIQKKLNPSGPLSGYTILKVNTYEVVFTLSGIDPNIWSDLLWPIFPVHKPNANLAVVGTGPFILKHIGTTRYDLSANAHYFLGEPKIKEITLMQFKNASDMIDAYENGTIDGYSFFNPSVTDMRRILHGLSKTSVLQSAAVSRDYYALFFNNKRITDKNIRQALSYSIDRSKIITLLHNQAEPENGPISTDSWAYSVDPGINRYNYSPPNAESLLSKSGYILKDGFIQDKHGNFLTATISYERDTPGSSILSAILADFENIGIKTQLKSYDSNDWNLNVIKNKNYDIAFTFVEGNVDPDSLGLWDTYGKSNLSGYSNTLVDHYLEFGRNITAIDQRKQAYLLFQENLMADAPAVFLYSPELLFIGHEDMRGIKQAHAVVFDSAFYDDIGSWYMK